jgi:hypothetical protein
MAYYLFKGLVKRVVLVAYYLFKGVVAYGSRENFTSCVIVVIPFWAFDLQDP